MADLLVVLGAGLALSGAMAWLNTKSSGSASMKYATFTAVWLGIIIAVAAVLRIAAEVLL